MGWEEEGEKGSHLPISRIVHSLHGHLAARQCSQLASHLGSDDGSHVADLGGTAGENKGQFLAAAAVLGHAVFG